MMGPMSTTSYTITASSNDEDIETILSTNDGQSWQPDNDELVHRLVVTISNEDETISDVILKGEYMRFVVTIQNMAGERPITNKVNAVMAY